MRQQLHFRLPGTWHRIDLRGGDRSEASIASVVRDTIGGSDDRARQRAELRRDLRGALEAARRAEATSMMFATEIAHRTPMPLTLVVHAPTRLRMSPSIGTAPEQVLAVLAESLGRHAPERAASLVRRTGAGAPALRTHRSERIEPVAETGDARRLAADYWLPVPGTKQVVLVRLTTPLGEIADLVLSLCDVLVEAAYFAPTAAPGLAEELRR
ncbi:hypothetical protein KUV85_08600 [Nocardioides panacisoli]|uniref:hypothetical protein n=1 Tax=Nocardioides panacisoli TaxID=627624 RepID=UPI001C62EFA7|nr:hypothetical protein [Nocardioides panacisoli]QYJ05722.1 hypothetical protein KUV85_08600 [Nocardioides panacisoli]